MSFRIISFGEVVWDRLPERAVLGGAPANFAVHCAALGADVRFISAVGDDAPGREVVRQLSLRGFPTESIQVISKAATGAVTVEFPTEGQPEYTIQGPSAWDFIGVDKDTIHLAESGDAICFGTLGQRSFESRESLRRILAAASPSSLRIFDANLRQSFFSNELIEFSLNAANVLKINLDELLVFSNFFGLSGDDLTRITQLSERFGLKCVALTRGSEGSLLLMDGAANDHAGIPIDFKDAIGAGDAFTSALTTGLLAGRSVEVVNEMANQLASYVASQSGATPKLPSALVALFTPSGSSVTE